jgi:hypothetical protein
MIVFRKKDLGIRRSRCPRPPLSRKTQKQGPVHPLASTLSTAPFPVKWCLVRGGHTRTVSHCHSGTVGALHQRDPDSEHLPGHAHDGRRIEQHVRIAGVGHGAGAFPAGNALPKAAHLASLLRSLCVLCALCGRNEPSTYFVTSGRYSPWSRGYMQL